MKNEEIKKQLVYYLEKSETIMEVVDCQVTNSVIRISLDDAIDAHDASDFVDEEDFDSADNAFQDIEIFFMFLLSAMGLKNIVIDLDYDIVDSDTINVWGNIMFDK